jgi:hypothetical protein
MVNPTLFVSAILCSALHSAAILWYQPPLPYTIFLASACATSMWNHGTTSTLAKWSDRAIMGIGLPVTFALAPTSALQALTVDIMLVYGLAKHRQSTPLHIVAHILITFINLQILASIR